MDFTNCKIDLRANYGGSDKKRGIYINGDRYMLKLSDSISDGHRNSLNSSYSNSSVSEHLCCLIYKSIGIETQDTILGTLSMKSKTGEDKVYPAVACKNFIPEGYDFVDFKFICNTLLDVKPGHTPKIEEIYEILSDENIYFSKEMAKLAMERYWDVFIIDSLLGNFDRHANNWGYLVNKETNELSLAPVYDCGSCMYPQMADTGIEQVLNDPNEIQMRIDKFPNAALEINNQKVNYKQFISSLENEDCNNALLRIYPKIDISKINFIIDNITDISDIRKTFYKTMINERYNQIIKEPYENLREQLGLNDDYDDDDYNDDFDDI